MANILQEKESKSFYDSSILQNKDSFNSNTLRDAQKLHFMQFRACCPRNSGTFCAKTLCGTVVCEQ